MSDTRSRHGAAWERAISRQWASVPVPGGGWTGGFATDTWQQLRGHSSGQPGLPAVR